MAEVQEIANIFYFVLSTLLNANVTEGLDNTKNIKRWLCLKTISKKHDNELHSELWLEEAQQKNDQGQTKSVSESTACIHE